MVFFLKDNFRKNFFWIVFTTLLTGTSAFAYEQGPNIYLPDILSTDMIGSRNHRIESVELHDGIYQFNVVSDFGYYNISSMGLLRERVREFYILGNAISQIPQRDDDLPGENRGQLVIRSDKALDIIKRPVSSASNLAGQVMENLNETLEGPAPEAETKLIYSGEQSSDPVTSLHKRNIASQWQFDVYSTNPKVQDFLNVIARERSSGNISAGTPSLNRFPVKPLKVKDSNLDILISQQLKTYSVEELNNDNKQILSGLNINQDLLDKFIQHPVFSPRHKTVISHYMQTLADVSDLSAFFQPALNARYEYEALAFENMAKMLAYYHKKEKRLMGLKSGENGLYGITEDNLFIYFINQDVTYWNERAEKLFDEILRTAEGLDSNQWIIISTGSFTEAASTELQKRGYELHQDYIY